MFRSDDLGGQVHQFNQSIWATYRLLWLNKGGHIVKSKSLECPTARSAMSYADWQTGDFSTLEVWEGKRQIYRISQPDY
jgi:hypothetical protein